MKDIQLHEDLMLEYDELLDLVDENDQVIGQLERMQVHAQGLHNFRSVNAFLVNPRGELWIPRRASHKKICPLGFDMSISGHVSSGETYDQAFFREALEEVNLDMVQHPYRVLGKVTPHEHGVFAFEQVYALEVTDAPSYNTFDFVGYEWLTPEDVLKRIAAGDKAKGDLPKLVQLFLHEIF